MYIKLFTLKFLQFKCHLATLLISVFVILATVLYLWHLFIFEVLGPLNYMMTPGLVLQLQLCLIRCQVEACSCAKFELTSFAGLKLWSTHFFLFLGKLSKAWHWKIFLGNFLRLSILIFFVNYFCLQNKLFMFIYLFIYLGANKIKIYRWFVFECIDQWIVKWKVLTQLILGL